MNHRQILIVDDEKHIAELFARALKAAGYRVLQASDGEKALMLLDRVTPDLILLDVSMPKMNGKALKARLNGNASTAGIPVVFVSALGTNADIVEGLSLGVDDYVTKPCSMEVLLAKVNALLARRAFYEAIAMTDGLTGLYNVHYFKKQLSLFFAMARRYKREFSLAVIDVDRLKFINDTYGHSAGDCVLKGIAAVMKETLRQSDIAARYGGDEFAVLLAESSSEQAMQAMRRFEKALAERRFVLDSGTALEASVSIGVASYVTGMESEQQLFEQADARMYQGKRGKYQKKCPPDAGQGPADCIV